MIEMKKLRLLPIVLVVGLLFLAACTSSKPAENLPVSEMTVFKSSSCGCCGVYAQYMTSKGFDVDVRDTMDMQSVKSSMGVPGALQSCHTTKIGDYFVEGHVPMEAVEKLLLESPDIAGIALPGMPSGTPGMPGPKSGSWTVYSVSHDGSYDVFMEL